MEMAPADLSFDCLFGSILEVAGRYVTRVGCFNIALSGGSLLDTLGRSGLARQDLTGWRVFLVDERMVPLDAADSNYGGVARLLEGTAAELFPAGPLDDPERAAAGYTAVLPAALDLCILGMGPDGHTASLFPGHPDFDPADGRACVPVRGAPKPPPSRISLSMAYINQATQVFFVVGGRDKEPAYRRVVAGDRALPAAHVRAAKWFTNF